MRPAVLSGVSKYGVEIFVWVEKERAFHPKAIVCVSSSHQLAQGGDTVPFGNVRQCSTSFFLFLAETCALTLQQHAKEQTEAVRGEEKKRASNRLMGIFSLFISQFS